MELQRKLLTGRGSPAGRCDGGHRKPQVHQLTPPPFTAVLNVRGESLAGPVEATERVVVTVTDPSKTDLTELRLASTAKGAGRAFLAVGTVVINLLTSAWFASHSSWLPMWCGGSSSASAVRDARTQLKPARSHTPRQSSTNSHLARGWSTDCLNP